MARGRIRRGSHVASPLERFDHSPFEYNDELLRATSYGFSSDSDAAFRRDRLMIVLRPCVTCHKFRLCSRFTAGRPLGVPYGIAYRRWERKRSQIAKNTRPTALCVGAVPAGSPCYEIWPYLFLYDGRFLRATNHEPLFFTSRGVPAAMSSI